MTRSHGVVWWSGRWLLPWIVVLLVSATFASAMNNAVIGDLANPDRRYRLPSQRTANSGAPRFRATYCSDDRH